MQPFKFNSVIELLEKFHSEQKCIDFLGKVRWNGNIISPFDPQSKVYICKNNRYKCKNTGKYFNDALDEELGDIDIVANYRNIMKWLGKWLQYFISWLPKDKGD